MDRNSEWRDAVTLFEAAVRVVPTSCKAHVCVAAAYNDLGTREARIRALPHLKKAFQLKPNYAGAHFMSGTIYRELGDVDQAAISFRRVIQHSSEEEYKPDVLYLGLVNYGALLMHGGMKNVTRHGTKSHQQTKAKEALKEAIVLEPKRYAPNANLAGKKF
jgi:Tfp pilus assembly protein PilF